MKTIAVGSENPVKLEAVRLAFEMALPEEKWKVFGTKVLSGVSDQPMSDAESIEGATNRAERAREIANSDFGVGIESGLHEIAGDFFESGWVVISSKDGERGIGSSVRIQVPEKMMKMVREGHEVGEADDILFGLENSKQGDGHFGLMTGNLITRTEGLRDAVIVALALFINPHIR